MAGVALTSSYVQGVDLRDASKKIYTSSMGRPSQMDFQTPTQGFRLQTSCEMEMH
jgi:hypothetical protein